MKIPTRMRYGTRALIELGAAYPGQPVSVKQVCEKQDLTPKYLEQIMAAFRAGGLVKSVRGAGGGYALARDPSEISLYDIYAALEGPFTLMDCLERENACPRASECPSRPAWAEAEEAFAAVLRRNTIGSLLRGGARPKPAGRAGAERSPGRPRRIGAR